MKPEPAPKPPATTSEISSLVATLRRTEQRLEELTAGEVDVVLDSEGRAFLLHRAQDELRRIESGRQAAILNALPTPIALLDVHGFIVSINEPWRSFAIANGVRQADYGIGLNYLTLFDGARADGASGAWQAAEGIRRVLDGGSPTYSLEYSCNSPQSERWYLLLVTPLGEQHPSGVVVMHLDITAERRAQENLRASEHALRESEGRFSGLLQNVELAAVMMDREARITYSNDALLRLSGWQREEVLGRDWFELFVPVDRAQRRAAFAARISDKGAPWHGEFDIITRSGELRLMHWNHAVLYSSAGDVIGSASLGEDITQKRQAESRLKRLNRVYAVLSGINSLIVRVRVPQELFVGACQIAIEHGRFKMAWIGVVNSDAKTIVPVASAVLEPDFPALIGVPLPSEIVIPMAGDSNAALAVRKKQPIIINEIGGDTTVVGTRERIQRGIFSMATLPLLISGKAIGVLALYADDVEFFDEEEIRLLLELAGNIAFAMDHIEKQARLDYLAYYDVLTGLANRHLFLERVAEHIRVAVGGAHQLAVFIIDLERFKNINDSFGQLVGDELLRQVASWLKNNVAEGHLLSRIGADQFAVVMPEVAKSGDLVRLVEARLAAFVGHPFLLNENLFRISATIGIAVFPEDGDNADALLKNTEAALKKAKATGNRYLLYTQKMTEAVAARLKLENRLRLALERREFVLHYQPKVDLKTGTLVGAEALIRWNSPQSGLVPPGEFIPILEQTGLIFNVGHWALKKAIEDFLLWCDAGLAPVRLAVNVSPLQLRQPAFVAEVESAIGVDPRAAAGLELEITESLIMEDVTHSIASLQAIRAMGVVVAIDDFGTGFSSLSYLAKLPIDTLKIDRSFIVAMALGAQGMALVSAIINVGQSLKLNVVAEGVETDEQSRLLRLLKCNQAQGFLFSKALPGDLFAAKFLAAPQ